MNTSDTLTQNCNHHIILDNFHGTVADVVDGGECITTMYEIFPWGTEIRSDVQRE